MRTSSTRARSLRTFSRPPWRPPAGRRRRRRRCGGCRRTRRRGCPGRRPTGRPGCPGVRGPEVDAPMGCIRPPLCPSVGADSRSRRPARRTGTSVGGLVGCRALAVATLGASPSSLRPPRPRPRSRWPLGWRGDDPASSGSTSVVTPSAGAEVADADRVAEVQVGDVDDDLVRDVGRLGLTVRVNSRWSTVPFSTRRPSASPSRMTGTSTLTSASAIDPEEVDVETSPRTGWRWRSLTMVRSASPSTSR